VFVLSLLQAVHILCCDDWFSDMPQLSKTGKIVSQAGHSSCAYLCELSQSWPACYPVLTEDVTPFRSFSVDQAFNGIEWFSWSHRGTEVPEQSGDLGFTCDGIKTKYGTGVAVVGEHAAVYNHEAVSVEDFYVCHAELWAGPSMVGPTIVLGCHRLCSGLRCYDLAESLCQLIQIGYAVHHTP